MQQKADKESRQEEDDIASGLGDDGLDRNDFERATAETRNIVARKTQQHYSEAHRATLETAYCHNPRLKRTAKRE